MRLRGERGYMSVLVDLEEARALVRGPDHGGLTSVELKHRLQIGDRIARALMAQRVLKTLTVVNPVNRCPTEISQNSVSRAVPDVRRVVSNSPNHSPGETMR